MIRLAGREAGLGEHSVSGWDTVCGMANGDLYEQIVDAANAIYGSHPHRRALHAKGLYCSGSFTATGEAAGLSRAAHLQGEAVPALVRFSNGSGNPESDDSQRDSRGMAVRLRPPGGPRRTSSR